MTNPRFFWNFHLNFLDFPGHMEKQETKMKRKLEMETGNRNGDERRTNHWCNILFIVCSIIDLCREFLTLESWNAAHNRSAFLQFLWWAKYREDLEHHSLIRWDRTYAHVTVDSDKSCCVLWQIGKPAFCCSLRRSPQWIISLVKSFVSTCMPSYTCRILVLSVCKINVFLNDLVVGGGASHFAG